MIILAHILLASGIACIIGAAIVAYRITMGV
jgi:hypothetical protein